MFSFTEGGVIEPWGNYDGFQQCGTINSNIHNLFLYYG